MSSLGQYQNQDDVMPDLFDWGEANARKTQGMEVAAIAQPTMLQLARTIAVDLCRTLGETDADEVGKVMHERHGVATMGPAAGSIFKVGFKFTGRRKLSARKTNHAREIKIWELG